MAVRVLSLDHLVLTVADIGASIAFYETALGMVAQGFEGADGQKRQALSFGDQKINLHEAGREIAPHARRAKAGSADLCFLLDGSVAEALTVLGAQGVCIELGPVERTGARGPILSIYIRDPDGNLIELSEPL